MSLPEILEAVRALTPEEQAQVRRLLDAPDNDPPLLMTEDDFEKYLAAKGVISIPSPLTEEERARKQAEFDAYQPVKVEGIPLSRMIVEERR